MCQEHRVGDKFYCRLQRVDPGHRGGISTGDIREAQIFVGGMGCNSNLTFAEATWTQGLSDWIGSHIRVFGRLGTVGSSLQPESVRSQSEEFQRMQISY